MDHARLYLLTVAAAIACAGLIPLVRRAAVARGVVDHPGERRAHAQPTPRLGGVAIFVAVALTLALARLLLPSVDAAIRANEAGAYGFAAGATVIFLGGLADDVFGLTARMKLCLQVIAASVVVAAGGCRVSAVSVPGGFLELGWLGGPVAIFWIVGVTNSVNLIDGLDGLAAGVSAIALAAIGAIAGPAHAGVSAQAAILVGASIGFLVHNFHPASIFMGDSGSLFLGFSMGVLSTYAGAKGMTGAITLAPVLILALPLTDTFWAFGRRYVRGLVPHSLRSHVAALARTFVPDQQHIHHRLVRAGLDHRGAIYVLYGLQALACAVAIFFGLPALERTVPRPGEIAQGAVASSTAP